MLNPSFDVAMANEKAKASFAEYLGITFTEVKEGCLKAEMKVKKEFLASNGYLHAGSIVTLADSVAGFSVMAHLPQEARSFTTIELKSNFLRTAREGILEAQSFVEHLGRTTQVWRVVVSNKETGKKMALFSCTQMILY